MYDPNSDFARHAKEWWDAEKAKQGKEKKVSSRRKKKGKGSIGCGVAVGIVAKHFGPWAGGNHPGIIQLAHLICSKKKWREVNGH